jgi:hypothetical protein
MAKVLEEEADKLKKVGKTTVSGKGTVVITDNSSESSGTDATVAVRGYTASRGYSNAVNWDGENALIGGSAVKPEYIKDGTAYAKKSSVDKAISEYEKSAGIRNREGRESEYNKRYGDVLKKAEDDMLSRSGFSYDPMSDPAYQAYAQRYMRLAEDAYRRVLNDNNTSVRGASGAVLSEAAASRDTYLKAITDIIPELEKNAYNRYSGESDRLRENYKALAEEAGNYYDRLYTADADAIKNVNSAAKAEHDEQQRQLDNQRNERLDAANSIAESYKNALNLINIQKGSIDLDYYDDMASEELKKARLVNEGLTLDNYTSKTKDVIDSAASRGFFTYEDEQYLPYLASYRSSAGGYTITPSEAKARYEYEIQHAKKLADLHVKLGM